MKINHVGYLTSDIIDSVREFELLGYIGGDVFRDPIQSCYICLLKSQTTDDCIELVEPFEDNIQMQKMLKKRGCSAYHICYEVDDVEETFKKYSEKEGWMNIFKPVVAIALGNRKITYFYNTKIGFVEFVNK